MLNLVVSLVKFLFEAVYVYAASDEGKSQLVQILDTAEADGVDVPFYEPSSNDGVQGEKGNVGDVGNDGSESSVDYSVNPTRKIYPKVE